MLQAHRRKFFGSLRKTQRTSWAQQAKVAWKSLLLRSPSRLSKSTTSCLVFARMLAIRKWGHKQQTVNWSLRQVSHRKRSNSWELQVYLPSMCASQKSLTVFQSPISLSKFKLNCQGVFACAAVSPQRQAEQHNCKTRSQVPQSINQIPPLKTWAQIKLQLLALLMLLLPNSHLIKAEELKHFNMHIRQLL